MSTHSVYLGLGANLNCDGVIDPVDNDSQIS